MKDCGPWRVRDTVWAKHPQSMVTEDGVAKGLRTILSERGMNTSNMRADDMRIVLSNHEDFANSGALPVDSIRCALHLVSSQLQWQQVSL